MRLAITCVLFGSSVLSAQTDSGPAAGRDAFQPAGEAAAVVILRAQIELIDQAELAAVQAGVLAFDVPEEGTLVEKGEIVAALDDTVPQASLAVAQAQASTNAEILSAEKVAKVAASEVASAKEANRAFPNTVNKLEYNRLELTAARSQYDVDVVKRDMAVAKARVAEAEKLLETYVVRAPFRGIVRKRHRRNGESVRQGDPVIELASTDRIRVVARVPILDLKRFQVGQDVTVEPDYNLGGPVGRLPGRVRFIDVFDGDVDREEVDVHIEVANPDGVLIPGLQATVRAN